MSRIGKKPVLLPTGIEATIEERRIIVKSAQAELVVPLPRHARVAMQNDPRALSVSVDDSSEVDQNAIWGLVRQLLENAVQGLVKPFTKSLEFIGVGFKVALEGRQLVMDLGFSHKVHFPLPEGIEAKVDKQIVTLMGADKYLIGETAARVRALKPPEPYKGKGIKYTDEVVRRKAGKTAKTSG